MFKVLYLLDVTLLRYKAKQFTYNILKSVRHVRLCVTCRGILERSWALATLRTQLETESTTNLSTGAEEKEMERQISELVLQVDGRLVDKQLAYELPDNAECTNVSNDLWRGVNED